jgi:molybdopterin-containing oxidoreductase family membrane subunit
MEKSLHTEPALIEGSKSLAQVTADVCAPLERRASLLWWAAFLVSFGFLLLGIVAVTYQTLTGIGTWGLNRGVGWAFDITNFVFWIGIGHAGTLISAILFLFRQRWRNSVNRSAEAMTLIAVTCAGLFPIIHMGRPWLFYWMLPYPNDRGSLWINFRSPLVWDFFAIATYFTISLVFWYVGLVPDLATLRDRVKAGWYGRLVSFFSLGWDGSARTWHRYESVYLILAGLATPLVVSVHSVVSTDFAASLLPGWHTTIFPPYFVAGAIFSGMAMVLTLMLIARKTMHLEAYITTRHVDAMAKLVLATSCLVGLAYATEIFTALYSGSYYEHFTLQNRLQGKLAWGFWLMVACNVLIPQLFWLKSVRKQLLLVFVMSVLVNLGMWFERFVIIVTALERDFLPTSWTDYAPTLVELATLAGSFGLFFTCFLVFCRFLPVIAIAEVKTVLDREPRRKCPTKLRRARAALLWRAASRHRREELHETANAASCFRARRGLDPGGPGRHWDGLASRGRLQSLPSPPKRRAIGPAAHAFAPGGLNIRRPGSGVGVLVSVLGVGFRLAAERGRPPVELVARLCACCLRDDGPSCRIGPRIHMAGGVPSLPGQEIESGIV